MKIDFKRLIPFTLAGAALGFSYYYFIGCNTGTCPISSDPTISTLYGSVMGVLLGTQNRSEQPQQEEQQP